MFTVCKVTIGAPRTLLPFNPELTKLRLDLGLTFRIVTEILRRGMIPVSTQLVDGSTVLSLPNIESWTLDAPTSHGRGYLGVLVHGGN